MFNKITHEVVSGDNTKVTIVSGPNPAFVRYQTQCGKCHTIFKFGFAHLTHHSGDHDEAGHYTINCPFCETSCKIKSSSVHLSSPDAPHMPADSKNKRSPMECALDEEKKERIRQEILKEFGKNGLKGLGTEIRYAVRPLMETVPVFVPDSGEAADHWLLKNLQIIGLPHANPGSKDYFKNWTTPHGTDKK